jgi:hypothetical protein
MRDPAIWKRAADGSWRTTDSIVNHVHDDGVEAARVPQTANWRPFEPTPRKVSPRDVDGPQKEYVIL